MKLKCNIVNEILRKFPQHLKNERYRSDGGGQGVHIGSPNNVLMFYSHATKMLEIAL